MLLVTLYLFAFFYACTRSLILWCIIFYTKVKSYKNILATKFWLLKSNSYLFDELLVLQWLLSISPHKINPASLINGKVTRLTKNKRLNFKTIKSIRFIIILISSVKKTKGNLFVNCGVYSKIIKYANTSIKKKIIRGWLQTSSAVGVSRKQEFYAFVVTKIY